MLGFDACLNENPLFRNVPSVKLTQGYPFIEGVRIGEMRAATLHVKYSSDLSEKVSTAVQRGEQWLGAQSNWQYDRVLKAEPDICFRYEKSGKYNGSESLLECGIMKSDLAWDAAEADDEQREI